MGPYLKICLHISRFDDLILGRSSALNIIVPHEKMAMDLFGPNLRMVCTRTNPLNKQHCLLNLVINSCFISY